jgi:hypothetical protein
MPYLKENFKPCGRFFAAKTVSPQIMVIINKKNRYAY